MSIARNLPARLSALKRLTGRTPLIEVECEFRGRTHHIYAKYEALNFTGSIKDRMALHILERAYAEGAIEPGAEIAEATSGNTGISFAAMGRALGHPVRIYMPDWMSRERVLVIQSLGAAVIPVSHEQGGFLGSIRMADEHAEATPGVFRPRQFDSDANVQAHFDTTGPEILAQLERPPTAFVAGVGTGGTVMGVGRLLRERVPGVAVHPLEPANSPTLRTGTKVGRHRIQGISDEFVPSIVRLRELDRIVDVWDGDAICMAQRLASELGIAVGISSGANFIGAIGIAHEQGREAMVTTVFCDDNKKYLSTDLCSDEECKDHYLSREVKLCGFRVIPLPENAAG
ncbi:MAG TPA: cysteine synthase family protein [Steroidobacteraceae bacterium]|nr:cysteine synthase family protein [Steroidobacteraceae bacterium]HQX79511.1 cysteine synthase family protein [Steroidobacteraceae bacterium]HQZ79089.1 cysteine synthase family protein [Steroidobacteraceae bacterium]